MKTWGLPKETHLGRRTRGVRESSGRREFRGAFERDSPTPSPQLVFRKKVVVLICYYGKPGLKAGVDCCIFNWSPALEQNRSPKLAFADCYGVITPTLACFKLLT